MEELCETFEKTCMLHDGEEAFKELSESNNMKLSDFSFNFISLTIKRYQSYLLYINLHLYADAGERIILLINDFLVTDINNLRLLASKCQSIDMHLLRLYDWEISQYS